MKKMLNVVLLMALAITLIGGIGTSKAAAAGELPFSDIANHWAKDNILKAYESGLVDGFPDGTFRPDAVVTGDQFVVMMLRAHSVTNNGKTEFDPEWYKVLGDHQPAYLNTFKQVVREQKFNFQPAASGYWAKPYIDFIYETPFIYTFDNVFPKDYELYKKQMTREQASYLLGLWYTRLEQLPQTLFMQYVMKNSGLKDFDNFGVGVGNYRADVLIAGLMNGYPNKYFYPQRYVTRAEALTMAQRLRDTNLRTPFKPNLKGQYWIEQDGQIYLFSDKFKHDTYKKILELANKHVKTGYIEILGSTDIAIFKSKDDYDKYLYMTKTLQFENRPTDELHAYVGEDTTEKIGITFPYNSNFANSKDYLMALYDLLAGEGKGKDLKKMVDGYAAKGMSETFTFAGKEYRFINHGLRYEVRYDY